MTEQNPENRCRIVLIAPEGATAETFPDALRSALAGGDVASLILPQYGLDETAFQKLGRGGDADRAGSRRGGHHRRRQPCRRACEGRRRSHRGQGRRRRCGRTAAVEDGGRRRRRKNPRRCAGSLANTGRTIFSLAGSATTTSPSRIIAISALGQWWAEMIEVPCIVLAGSDIASVETVGRTRRRVRRDVERRIRRWHRPESGRRPRQ